MSTVDERDISDYGRCYGLCWVCNHKMTEDEDRHRLPSDDRTPKGPHVYPPIGRNDADRYGVTKNPLADYEW